MVRLLVVREFLLTALCALMVVGVTVMGLDACSDASGAQEFDPPTYAIDYPLPVDAADPECLPREDASDPAVNGYHDGVAIDTLFAKYGAHLVYPDGSVGLHVTEYLYVVEPSHPKYPAGPFVGCQ